MHVGVSQGRVIVRGTLAVWGLDAVLLALFAAFWWFWVPGGTWLPLRAVGPVVGVCFAVWWLMAARLIIEPEADRVTYVGLWSRSIALADVRGVDGVNRMQEGQGVPCLRLKTARGSVKCRAASALSASRVHLTARLVGRVLESAKSGEPVTQRQLEEWRFLVRPDRPATRALPD